MKDTLLKVLSWVDTPTVCNAIEIVQGQRGFDQFTKSTVQCSSGSGLPVVGFARTARIAAKDEPKETQEVLRKRRLDYYRYVSDSTNPSVMVIEDTDYPNCVGAFWGEINAQIHTKFGLSGVLTNGVMRDLDDVPERFPIIAGSIGPSHAYVHVKDFGKPVNVFGLSVQEGDFIHADRHGAVVIPPEVLPNMDQAIARLIELESVILGPVSQENFTIDDLQKAWDRFEAMRV